MIQIKTVYLIVGESASGKTTIVNQLCDRYGYKTIDSYTTRKPRYKGEKGHIFVDDLIYHEHKAKDSICAYTHFNSAHYWATFQQLLETTFYIIDKKGIDYLKSICDDKYNFITIYISVPFYKRLWRMYKRDGLKKAISRFINDLKMFRGSEYDYKINNKNLDKSVDEINNIIKSNLKEKGNE